PTKPQSTLIRNILLSLLAGLVSAGAIGLILENLDAKIQTSEDLARLTESQILGTIPFLKNLSYLKFLKKSKNLEFFGRKTWIAFLEAYSFLYTNLFFLRQKQNKTTLVISSASPGEGKSTISFFLAQASANMGHKVLLVDGDRYFPQKEYWQTLAQANPGQFSASSFPNFNPQTIYAQGMKPEKVRDNFYIMQYENLSLSMMMEEKELYKVINDWKSEFDLILIDAPPVLGLSDTKLIANQADGILLVVRMHYTDRQLIKETLLELRLSNLPVMGLIVNGSTDNNRGQYYKYYQGKSYYQAKSQKMIV
ncbi:MAG: AAA family ATPase, partial [Snowella sp.]